MSFFEKYNELFGENAQMFLETYISEGREFLNELDTLLLSVEKRGHADIEDIDELFRIVHTQKGSAVMMELDNIASAANKLEDMFSMLRENPESFDEEFSGIIDAVFLYSDFMESEFEKMESDDYEPGKSNELFLNIDDIKKRIGNKKNEKSIRKSAGFSQITQENIRVSQAQIDMLFGVCEEFINTVPELGLGKRERIVIDRLVKRLNDIAYNMRTTSIENLVPKLERVMRDICKKQDKKVMMETIGKDVRIDKKIVDELFEPLMHMVRNSVDHGMMLPDERAKRNKEKIGKITIEVINRRGITQIKFYDDGEGINFEAVERKARQEGILEDREYSREELSELLTMPGFSTNETVGEYSGRGVGLDSVVKMVSRLGGHAVINSSEGKGFGITMQFPADISSADCVSVVSGGMEFAFPVYQVKRFAKAEKAHSEEYPIVSLNDVYGLDGEEDVVIFLQGIKRSGFVSVGRVRGIRHFTEKPVPAVFGEGFAQNTGITGFSRTESGSVCMILDCEYVLKRGGV